jgi:hypothetical protein
LYCPPLPPAGQSSAWQRDVNKTHPLLLLSKSVCLERDSSHDGARFLACRRILRLFLSPIFHSVNIWNKLCDLVPKLLEEYMY